MDHIIKIRIYVYVYIYMYIYEIGSDTKVITKKQVAMRAEVSCLYLGGSGFEMRLG